MLHTAQELGLLVQYVELGNELYLSNPDYVKQFPTATSYGQGMLSTDASGEARVALMLSKGPGDSFAVNEQRVEAADQFTPIVWESVVRQGRTIQVSNIKPEPTLRSIQFVFAVAG